MNSREIFRVNNLLSAGAAGALLTAGIAIERVLSKSDDVVLAAFKQGGVTFATALFYISLYDYLKTVNLGAFDSIKRPLIISALAAVSGAINYFTQQDTGGSIQESVAMFILSAGALTAHEFDVGSKVKDIIHKNKLQILEILIITGNTLGLK